MTLYLLEWDNGQDYADHDSTLLGIYSSAGERSAAKERYLSQDEKRTVNLNDDGNFVAYEITLDHDIYL